MSVEKSRNMSETKYNYWGVPVLRLEFLVIVLLPMEITSFYSFELSKFDPPPHVFHIKENLKYAWVKIQHKATIVH